jgi:transglutaminase-like putative cysteine protease
MENYLRSTEIIDWQTPAVVERAHALTSGHSGPVQTARSCFEWVRDDVKHSGDHEATVATCNASDVLRERTGWCFAKSHLLAALLRANGIAAGLCYQRLLRDDGIGFTLHGLVAVCLPEAGWYRIDARGNKAGIDAQFCPRREKLAWTPQHEGEMDFPEIWPDPVPIVVAWLQEHQGSGQMQRNLPDVAVISRRRGC